MNITMDPWEITPTYTFEPEEEVMATTFTELNECWLKKLIIEAQQTILGLTFLGTPEEVQVQQKLHGSLQGRVDVLVELLQGSKEAKLRQTL